MTVVVDFDALWRGVETEYLCQLIEEFVLGCGFCQAAAQGIHGIAERMFHEFPLLTTLGDRHHNTSLSSDGERLAQKRASGNIIA